MNVEQSILADYAVRPSGNPVVNWLRKHRWFAIFVLLPTFLAAIYNAFLAPDVYISESSFVVQSVDQKTPQLGGLASLLQTGGVSSGGRQSEETLEYIQSRDALRQLQKTFDIASRLKPTALEIRNPFQEDTFEQLYREYGDKVSAHFSAETGLSVLKVEAYNPKDAYQINAHLLGLSEDLVNALNARSRHRAIDEAQKQVQLAEKRSNDARVALAQYRNANALLDPQSQGEGVLSIANGLITQRASLQAKLDVMERLTPSNPSIPALRNQIATISAQIQAQEGEAVGAPHAIASKLQGYEKLLAESEFAAQNLAAANASLVKARAQADQQEYYLERIVEPNVPDEPELPHRFLNVVVVLASLTCLYFVIWMFVVGILEHAPED
ncbi:capsule biosynthesis protein [Novosphingobium sp. 1949]|uniref:Capsule biosynthesis protein n=1 Tax=Novosphingobium organovorum TaxID=2930092 RepID=A0ABT0BGM8_9SPHN|nr:capsule biosynthesis protein [Novosphingobium organovorum]MCJ2184187.1 capsule biosynthesis protein [Novosphingobium organovorum]